MRKTYNIGNSFLLSDDSQVYNSNNLLIPNLPQEQRKVTIVDILPINDLEEQLIVEMHDLIVPQIEIVLVEVKATFQHFLDGKEPSLELKAIKATHLSDNVHYLVSGIVNEFGELSLIFHSANKTTSRIPEKAIERIFRKNSHFTDWLDFNHNELFHNYLLSWFEGEQVKQIRQQFTLNLPVDSIPLISKYAHDIQLFFSHTLLIDEEKNVREHLSWRGLGTLHLDHGYAVSVGPNRPEQLVIAIDAGEEGFPGPEKLVDYFHLSALTPVVEAVEKHLPFLQAIRFQRFFLETDFKKFSSINTRVEGSVMLDKYRFDFSIYFQQLIFETALSVETPIPLEIITKHLFSDGLSLPHSAEISEFTVHVGIQPLSMSLTFGVSNLWKFNLGETPIEMKEVRMMLQKERDQDFNIDLEAKLYIGEVDFEVSARNNADEAKKGWLFETKIGHEHPVALRDFVESLSNYLSLNVPPEIPDVTIHDLQLSFHTGTHDFHFSGSAELMEKLGFIDRGTVELSIDITKATDGSNHEIQINIHGAFEVEKTTLNFWAELGHPDWMFAIDWIGREGHSLHLYEIATIFDKHADFSGLSDEVKNALSIERIRVEYRNDEKAFRGFLKTEGGQEGIIAGKHSSSKTKFLIGLGYQKPEEVPNIGNHLSKLDKTVELRSLWFLFNTFSVAETLPDLPEAFPHALNPAEIAQGMGVVAEIDFKQSSHKGLNHLKIKNGKPTKLLLYGAFFKHGESFGIKLSAKISGKLFIPTGAKNDLALENAGFHFELHGTSFDIEVHGTIHIVVDHKPISTRLQLELTDHSAHFGVDVQFEEQWHPFGLKVIGIDHLGFLIGTTFEPPSVELGFQAEFDVLDKAGVSRKNKVGMVIGFVEEIPNPEYFALFIERLDFSDLLTMFRGNSDKGNEAVGTNLNLSSSNLSIYWAENELTLPDGTVTRPGFGLHGEFDIFGWRAYAHLDVHEDTGIAGHAETDQIDWSWLKIGGDGNGVYAQQFLNEETGKPERVVNTNISENRTVQMLDDPEEIVAPNGPLVHFDSNHSPFVSASVHVKFLGIASAELDLEVVDDGFSFDLHLGVEHLMDFRLFCELKKGTSFHANGHFKAGIQEELDTFMGDILIELGVHANLKELTITKNPSDFRLIADFGVDFMGSHVEFIQMKITDFPEQSELIPAWLLTYFGGVLFPPLKETLDNLYQQLVEEANHFDQEKYDYAAALRENAISWEALVEADLKELQSQMRLDDESIKQLAESIAEQADEMLGAGIHQQVTKLGQDESQRLSGLHQRMAELHEDNSVTSAQIRQLLMERQEREIMELDDRENLLKSTILGIWESHRTTFEKMFEPDQDYRNLKVYTQIQDEVKALMVEDESTPKSPKPFPNEKGKFTPRAVKHHAFMIESDEILGAQEHWIEKIGAQQLIAIEQRTRSLISSLS